MPTPWFRRARRAAELTVYNKADAWSHAVEKALVTFNGLGFPVKLVATDDERNPLIVVKLSMGPDSLTSWGQTVSTGADFDAKELHGRTKSLTEVHERTKTHEIIFAGIFLPGKAEATNPQKEVIIVHEFIHACGLDGGMSDGTKDPKGQDHDSVGIMFPQMMKSVDGLIEYIHDDKVNAMPPIRVGGHTVCKIQMIWGTEACKQD